MTYRNILLWMSWLIAFLSYSQDQLPQVFSNRTLTISLGYGVPNLTEKMFNLTILRQSNALTNSWGPLHLRSEQAVAEWFGIGVSVNIAYFRASWKTTDPFNPSTTYLKDLQVTSMSFLLRSWLHFVPRHPFIDPYFSFGFGYRWNEVQYNNGGDPYDDDALVYDFVFPMAFEAALGFRYYITRNLAIYAETGIAKSIINFGLTLKIERDPLSL